MQDLEPSSPDTQATAPLTGTLQHVLRYLQSWKELKHLQARRLKKPEKDKCIELQRLWGLLVDGYNAGLETSSLRLTEQLKTVGICEGRVLYEGAATAKSSLCLTGKFEWSELDPFLSEVEPYSVATLGLGVGAAFAHLRLPLSVSSSKALDYWSWMACDSFGFTHGMYNSHATIIVQEAPVLSALPTHAFDQGVGRSIYFVSGADPRRIVSMINLFPPEKHHDLWRGVGLMTGYWGLLDARDVKHLLKNTAASRSAYQQGISLAALLRLEGSGVPDFCEEASRISCGASAEEVAQIAVEAMPPVPPSQSALSFYGWQHAIDSSFSAM